jgi:hypothetical protein
MIIDKQQISQFVLFATQILSKTASNAVMETVDPDISDTCQDLGEVKKIFQLALLCTKRQPSDRPTMHEVVRVLDCLVHPDPPPKPVQPLSSPQTPAVHPSYANEYVSLRGAGALSCANSSSTSDAELFLKFGEAISHNTE